MTSQHIPDPQSTRNGTKPGRHPFACLTGGNDAAKRLDPDILHPMSPYRFENSNLQVHILRAMQQ
jgi:hypothetical protein